MHTNFRPVLPILALVTLSIGCQQEAPAGDAPPIAKPADHSASSGAPERLADAVKLVELFSEQHIKTSPLQRVHAPGPIPAQTVFAEDFSNLRPARLGWKNARLTIRPAGDGRGKAMHYKGGGGHRSVIVVPAQGAGHYRFSRTIKTSDRSVDLRVLETNVALKYPQVQNHPEDVRRVLKGRFVAMKDLLFVHRFAPPKDVATWQSDTLQLQAGPSAKSFILILDDAESLSRAKGLSVWLDDLRVERLSPTADHMLQRFASQDQAPKRPNDNALVSSLRKFGQLLPTENAAKVEAPFDRNFDYRTALAAPAPSHYAFTLRLPQNARLDFSYGLSKLSSPGASVRFRVEVSHGEQRQEVFSTLLKQGPKGEQWYWHDAQVNLAPFAGEDVTLHLFTESPSADAGCALALWGNPIVSRPRDSQSPPNILMIAIDTLRADHLSSYGHPNATSPNIDSLAKDGLRFDQATSSSNWTTSAFASMFTGLMPSTHQVVHRARALSPNLKTLPEYFQEAGWQTQAVAYKAYLYNMGFEQGFDSWFNLPRTDNTAQDNLDQAMAWLGKNLDRRFFMFFHLNDPHQPMNQPQPFDRKFNSAQELVSFGIRWPMTIGIKNNVLGCSRCSENGRLKESFKPLGRALYDGAIAFADNRIGALIQSLKDRGVYDDTIIVVVADHGEVMWDRANYFGHGGIHMTDDLTRVPLIIKPHKAWFDRPNALPAGSSIETQVAAYDLLPTLATMVDLPQKPSPQSARDLTPLMLGDNSEVESVYGRVVISENVKQNVTSARVTGWKYILQGAGGQGQREALYDLKADAGELQDVAAKHPEVLAKLRQAVVAHFLNNRSGAYLYVPQNLVAQKEPISVDMGEGPWKADLELVMGQAELSHGKNTVFPSGDGPVLIRIKNGHGKPLQVRTQSGQTIAMEANNTLAKAPQAKGPTLLPGNAPIHTYSDKSAIDADQLATLRALGYIH